MADIFRFEVFDRTLGRHKGVYSYDYLWRLEEHEYSTGRPGPISDKGLNKKWNPFKRKNFVDDYDLFFGFDTIEKMTRWFSNRDELQMIFGLQEREGYLRGCFCIYEDIEKFFSSRYQAVFIKPNYEPKRIYTFEEYNTFIKNWR